ncbi:MAG: hypothetical protein KJP23_27560 [Deltaproteobacteria bacterium]|nr:hypothetical protein [Deltaproteobacteria bacterium]
MKLFKLTIIVSAFVLISAVAWAGNCPEYDAVGVDYDNFYSQYTVYYKIVNYEKYYLEMYSDFTDNYLAAHPDIPLEGFKTNAGQLGHVKYDGKYRERYVDNPCFPGIRVRDGEPGDGEVEEAGFGELKYAGPPVAKTAVWNEGTYEWWIVLQMKPESDINVNIYDCVLKENQTNLWFYAEQTGRYRMSWGELMFEGNGVGNPVISVEAHPGEFATTAFKEWHSLTGAGMVMDARTLPGLVRVPLDEVTYTSKAHWPEGIVVALPKTGDFNATGQPEFNLKQGDVIHVTLQSITGSADIWYGPQSVILKYIGIVNTDYFDDYEKGTM